MISNFARTFLELLGDPDTALGKLIASKDRFYGIIAVPLLVGVIFIPIFYFFARYNFLATNIIGILGLAAVLLATTFIFCLITPFFLSLFGTRFTVAQIAEAYSYAITPLIPIILLYYAANLIFLGRLSGVLYVITGVRDAYDWILPALPVLHILGQILFLNVFCRALRIMQNLGTVEAAILGVISAVPFYLALFTVTTATEYIYPYAANIIWRFLRLFLYAW